MAKKETTSEERSKYILEQRAADKAYEGRGRRIPADMSFIDRAGNIIRPNREEHYAPKKKPKN